MSYSKQKGTCPKPGITCLSVSATKAVTVDNYIIHSLRILGGEVSDLGLIVCPSGHRAKSDRKTSYIFAFYLVISRVAVSIDDVREYILRRKYHLWTAGRSKEGTFVHPGLNSRRFALISEGIWCSLYWNRKAVHITRLPQIVFRSASRLRSRLSCVDPP